MAKPLGFKRALVLLVFFGVAWAAWLKQIDADIEADAARVDDMRTVMPVDTRTCESIPQADRRHHCLALALEQVRHCAAIVEADTRHLCQAQVTDSEKPCLAISKPELRAECTAMSRH